MRGTFDSLQGSISLVSEDYRNLILFSVAVGWLFNIGIRLSFPAIMPFIRAEFQISLATAGLLLSLLWFMFAIGGVFGGVLSDQFGERTILTGSFLLIIITAALLVLSAGIKWFFLSTILFGLATGFYSTTRFTVLTDLYPKNSGMALGISSGIGNVGAMILPIVAVFVAGAVSWRAGVGFTLPLLLAVVVGLWMTVPSHTSERFDDNSENHLFQSIASILRPRVIVFMLVMFCMNFLYQSFTSFYPSYLIEGKGLSEETAGILYGLFFACAIIIQPSVGMVGDRLGRKRTIGGTIALSMIALLMLPFFHNTIYFVLITVLISAQFGFWPVATAHLIDYFPEQIQGSAFGISRTTFLIMGSTGPVISGRIANAGYFDEVFLLLSGITGISGLLMLVLIRSD